MRNDDDMVIRGSEENRPTVQKVVAKSEVCCLSNSRSRLVSGWKSRPVKTCSSDGGERGYCGIMACDVM